LIHFVRRFADGGGGPTGLCGRAATIGLCENSHKTRFGDGSDARVVVVVGG
jgi:hypothetical protein